MLKKRILIKKYYDEREKLLNESKDIFNNLKKSDEEDVKIDLRKKYSSIIKEINNLTLDFKQDLYENNYSLMIEDGNVEIINDNYNIQKVKQNLKKLNQLLMFQLLILKKGMKVEWKERNKTLNGIVHKINK